MSIRTGRFFFWWLMLFFILAVSALLRQSGPRPCENQDDDLCSAVTAQYRPSRLLEQVTEKKQKQPVSGLIPPYQASLPTVTRARDSSQTHGSLLVPVSGARLTSPFGPRGEGMHWGVDLAAPEGRPVRAAAAGEVIFAGWNGAYGLLIILEHQGFRTYYAHNSALLAGKRDQVAAGEIIAAVGRTGRATGSHLHFELEIQGRKVNPLPYLRTTLDLKSTPEPVITERTVLVDENSKRKIKNEKAGGNGEK